jgi:hypothetical protein
MANNYDQSMASINAGSAKPARPMLRIERVVFWFMVLTALPALGYHYGFEAGFEKARAVPAKCADRSPEGKALSGVAHDEKNNVTFCTYIQSTYGRGKWQGRV